MKPDAITLIRKAARENESYLSLADLDMTNVEFESVQNLLLQLAGLTSLDLSNNRLSKLPTCLGQLANLTELSVSRNELSFLPYEIGQLTKLTQLHLRSNRISFLPDEFRKLRNLKFLDLGSNLLKAIPTEIADLRELEELILAGNPLEEIPLSLIWNRKRPRVVVGPGLEIAQDQLGFPKVQRVLVRVVLPDADPILDESKILEMQENIGHIMDSIEFELTPELERVELHGSYSSEEEYQSKKSITKGQKQSKLDRIEQAANAAIKNEISQDPLVDRIERLVKVLKGFGNASITLDGLLIHQTESKKKGKKLKIVQLSENELERTKTARSPQDAFAYFSKVVDQEPNENQVEAAKNQSQRVELVVHNYVDAQTRSSSSQTSFESVDSRIRSVQIDLEEKGQKELVSQLAPLAATLRELFRKVEGNSANDATDLHCVINDLIDIIASESPDERSFESICQRILSAARFTRELSGDVTKTLQNIASLIWPGMVISGAC